MTVIQLLKVRNLCDAANIIMLEAHAKCGKDASLVFFLALGVVESRHGGGPNACVVKDNNDRTIRLHISQVQKLS